jgi:hypothetical protein
MVEDLIQKTRIRACASDSVAIDRIEQWNARGGILENDKFEMSPGPLSFSYLMTRSPSRASRGSVLNSVMCIIGIERRQAPLSRRLNGIPCHPARAYPMPWDMYDVKA